MPCTHERWLADVSVSNLLDLEGNLLDRRAVDLRVICADCSKPLQFVGMPAGSSVLWPTTSVDGLEARLSAVPQGVVMSPLAEFAIDMAPSKFEQN